MDAEGRRERDYARRVYELFKLIKQIPDVSDRDLDYAHSIFFSTVSLDNVAFENQHPAMLSLFNRLTGSHQIF